MASRFAVGLSLVDEIASLEQDAIGFSRMHTLWRHIDQKENARRRH